MLDFNSRSALADRINYMIDAEIDKAGEKSQQRGYLGASVIGNECERHVQYHLMAAQGTVERHVPKPRILRIFDRGNLYEEKARQWLKSAGFIFGFIPGVLPPNSFEDFDGTFRGHADGVITGWKKRTQCPIELPVLWENKCLSAKNWKKVSDNKLQKYSSTYYAQVQIYMHYLNLPRCLFTAVNADTMEIYHELVEFNQMDAELYKSRAHAAIMATKEGYMLNRISNDPSYYVCRMCDFAEVCHANSN